MAKPFPVVVGPRMDLGPSPLILSPPLPVSPLYSRKRAPGCAVGKGCLVTSLQRRKRGPVGLLSFQRPLVHWNPVQGPQRARARRRGRACLWCLEIKAANLGLFLPLTLRHFYWRDEGRQTGPTVLALLLEVNDPVSSSWLRFRHFADIKPRVSAKYILFSGAHPMHLRLLCNATKRERWLGGALGSRRGEPSGRGEGGMPERRGGVRGMPL